MFDLGKRGRLLGEGSQRSAGEEERRTSRVVEIEKGGKSQTAAKHHNSQDS